MELRARIFELERQSERRDEKTSQASNNANSQRKRKRVETEVGESLNRTPKQVRTISTTRTEDTLLPVLMNELEALPLDFDCNTLLVIYRKLDADLLATILHNIRLLQQIKSQKNPPLQELATMLSRLSTNVSRMISDITPDSTGGLDNGNVRRTTTGAQNQSITMAQESADPEFDSKIGAIFRIFRWLLNSVDVLPAGKSVQSQIIYSFIMLFRDLLNRICDLAVSYPAEHATKAAQNTKNARSARPKATNASPRTNKTVMALTRLLITMTTSFEPANLIHQAILDGFLHFLLTRVGNLLSVSVFSNPINLPNLAPAKDNHTSPTTNTHDIEAEKRILESQAPHLIAILSHLPHSKAHPLAEKSKRKLQHTLLKSIFGHQTDEFVHALIEPRNPLATNFNENPDAGMEAITRKYAGNVGDWFKGEVWRLVGWDILAQHIEWPDEGYGGVT